MEEKKDFVADIADKYGKAATYAKNTLKSMLNYVLLIFLILMTAVLSFAQVALVDGITKDVLVDLCYTLAINITSMVVFIPQGEDNEKKKSQSYYANLKLWGAKTKILEDRKLLTQFNKFCREKSLELRQNKIEEFVKLASLNMEDYEKSIKNLSKRDLKRAITDEKVLGYKLSKEQVYYILKAKGRIRIPRINPSIVLAGSDKAQQYASLQPHMKQKTKAVSIKMIGIVIWSLLLVSVMLVPTGYTGWLMMFKFIMRIAGVVSSTIVGFYTGINQIKTENNENKEKIFFIDEFLETIKEREEN